MKLTKHDLVTIGTEVLTYDPSDLGGNPPFKAEESVSTGYTDISTIENWPMFGEETLLTVEGQRNEISALVVAKTFSSCTDPEKDVASEWFVVDKADRDTRHNALQQEANAERLVRRLFSGLPENNIITCRDSIKNADVVDINNEIQDVNAGSSVIKVTGAGNKALHDDGAYKTVSGGGTQYHIINFGVDGIYTSAITNPAWAVLTFRILVGSLSDYFNSGTKLKGKIIANCDISGGITGRIRMMNETASPSEMVGIHNEDVNTILWQSGNTIRYTFNGTPDLTKIKVEDTLHVDSATNASNNGDFIITAVNNAGDYIEITNPGRSDVTDDEASDSLAVAEGGAILQFTNGTLQIIKSLEFEIPQNKEFRLELNRSSSGGNPTARIGAVQLLIWSE